MHPYTNIVIRDAIFPIVPDALPKPISVSRKILFIRPNTNNAPYRGSTNLPVALNSYFNNFPNS